MKTNIRLIGYIVFVLNILFVNNAKAFSDEISIEDSLCEVTAFEKSKLAKKPALKLKTFVKSHPSGAAYVIDLELTNDSNRNVVIRTPLDLSEAFLPIVFLNEDGAAPKILEKLKINGIGGMAQLSKPLKKYMIDGPEKQKHDEFTLKAGDKKQWQLYLKDILQTNDAANEALVKNVKGYLMIGFIFKYYLDAKDCDHEYRRGAIRYSQYAIFSLESYLSIN